MFYRKKSLSLEAFRYIAAGSVRDSVVVISMDTLKNATIARFQATFAARRRNDAVRNGLGRVAKEEGEKEEEAAARRLFEAWKRALDATIEVPDCEPAINASSPWKESRGGKGEYGGAGVDEGERTREERFERRSKT